MKNILKIHSSPAGDYSFSNKLADAIVDKIVARNPGSNVKFKALYSDMYPHLGEVHLGAWFSAPDQHSEEQKSVISFSDLAVQEFLDADTIVIGVPMHNFGIPSNLKAWIDHIVRAGKTFEFRDGIPVGLVNGKTVYIAMSSGSIYSDGPYKPFDFVDPYLRAILGYIGVYDVSTVRAEGTAIPGVKDMALQRAIDSIQIQD